MGGAAFLLLKVLLIYAHICHRIDRLEDIQSYIEDRLVQVFPRIYGRNLLVSGFPFQTGTSGNS